jgi:hypothetical protein
MTCTKSRPVSSALSRRGHAREDVGGCGVDPVKRGVKRADAAARQDLLDGGKAMAVADPVEMRQRPGTETGSATWPASDGRHEAARLGVEDGAGVETGAEPTTSFAAWGEWGGWGRTSIRFSGAILPIAWPCACKVVQDGGPFRRSARWPARPVDAPVEVGQLHHPVAHRPAPATQTPPISASDDAGLRDRRR